MSTGKFIGKGAFGEIRVVKWRGTIVAAKTITAELSKDPQILKEFVAELALLSNLSHPNIVQFLGAVTKQRPMVMVTEYLPKGDLHDLMERKGKLDARTSVRFALDIARGMNYLHEHKPNAIVHRDLKPRNLLKHEAGHLKVADFGLGKFLDPLAADNNALYEMTGETGSYRYMAPEVFMHKHYDKSVDVFSFAIIVQEMFEGSSSLKYQLPKSIAISRAKDMQRPSFNIAYPSGMKELIKECWDSDPSKRPTFAMCIKRLEKIQVDAGFVSNGDVSEKTEKREKCTIM
jgi:serine/threonine protein kinase